METCFHFRQVLLYLHTFRFRVAPPVVILCATVTTEINVHITYKMSVHAMCRLPLFVSVSVWYCCGVGITLPHKPLYYHYQNTTTPRHRLCRLVAIAIPPACDVRQRKYNVFINHCCLRCRHASLDAVCCVPPHMHTFAIASAERARFARKNVCVCATPPPTDATATTTSIATARRLLLVAPHARANDAFRSAYSSPKRRRPVRMRSRSSQDCIANVIQYTQVCRNLKYWFYIHKKLLNIIRMNGHVAQLNCSTRHYIAFTDIVYDIFEYSTLKTFHWHI